MENLPQELIDRISSHLDVVQLKQTLMVNQKFQAAAERYSGAFDEVSIDEKTAQKFFDTFSSHRFRYLRRIKFATTLPAPQCDPDAGRPPCRESQEDLKALDEDFTRQIRLLFDVISKLEARVQSYSPGNVQLTIYTPFMDVDPNLFCRHRAFVSWRVHLLAPQHLPILGSIRALRVVNGTSFSPFKEPWRTLRKLDLRVLVDIANKLPNLGALACEIGGDEWPTPLTDETTANFWRVYQGPRRDTRHDFASAVENISMPPLREVLLNFICPNDHNERIDQRVAMPDLVAPARYDPFSSSLRTLSYSLRRMCIFAVVDSTLFLPRDGSTPSWPYLESVNVRFHMASPSGTWYFKGLQDGGRIGGYKLQDESAYPPLEKTLQDEEEDEEEDYVDWQGWAHAQFRVMPDDDVLGPFLAAFAKSTQYMPSLKEAALWCPLKFSVEDMGGLYEDYDSSEVKQDDVQAMAWGIAYTAPGQKAFSEHPGVDKAACRQLWWKVGKCRPNPRVCELVRQVGRQQHGDDLIEHWEDEYYGDGLVDRDIFEAFEWRVFPDFNLDLFYY
ncbi:hypothetical protein SLS60_002645 [Paraconiothyrium brasiliense]|uniref:F-box domain-containing protein n=1 Tax=Paraconiothyrium brasiliense TaxID=300254 RepID=A0ABR3RTI6_9PLEO